MTTPPDTAGAGWLRRLPIIVILLVAVAGAVTLRDHLTFDTLRENRAALLAFRDSHYAMTALAFVAAYVTIVTFSLPGATLATLTAGFLFGMFPGALFAVASATTGAVLVFLAARTGFGDRLAARIEASEGRVRRLRDAIRENEVSVLLLIRLIPVVPFFVANLIPAFMGVSLRVFVLTTFFGIIPGGLVYTAVGNGLGAVFEAGGRPDMGLIFEPRILLPILGLAALAALPVVVRLFRRRVI